MEYLIRVTPNKEKAKSILKMVETTLEMAKTIDKNKFASNVTKEYYDAIRELSSIILLLDGYKADGDGVHKKQIDYLEANYKQFSRAEVVLMDDLRVTRNKISYDGFFVKENYLDYRMNGMLKMIAKLKRIIGDKIGNL